VVAVGLIALTAHASLGAGRARSLVWPLSAAVAFVLLRRAPLYIHPDHPVQSSTPLGIRAAFVGIFLLFLVASLFLAQLLHGRGGEQHPIPE
jgi:hypothetical protein